MAGDAIEADLLCRACAAPHYGEKVDLQAVPALMEFYNWLSQSQVDSMDLLPKQICMQCYDRLDEFHRFQLMCAESNNLLLARFSKCIISKGGESFEISFKDDTSNNQDEKLDSVLTVEPEKNNCPFSSNRNTSRDNGSGLYTNSSEYDDEFGGSYKYLQSDCYQTSEIDIKPDIGTLNYTAFLDQGVEINNSTVNSRSNVPKESSATSKNYGHIVHDAKAFLYQCDKCPRKFNVKERYEGHLRWHVGLKPFACKQCHKKYSRLERLRNHVLSDHSDSPRRFYCTIEGCKKKYKNRETWKKHVNLHGKELQASKDVTLTGVDFLADHVFPETNFASGIWNL